MLQHIVLDLGVGCPILKFGHIHIFQRELNPNLFRVDLALGKQDNRLDVIIIDEASQADIFSLAILYMGKKLIVVGDDKQVKKKQRQKKAK